MDNIIEPLLNMDYNVKIFDVENYLCWELLMIIKLMIIRKNTYQFLINYYMLLFRGNDYVHFNKNIFIYNYLDK